MVKQTKEPANLSPKCGIIMPISAIDGCSTEHWSDVLNIIKDSVRSAEFEPNLVSDADESGIIQKRIIHNLYSNEIVICDVSGKNPNVMFELGIRLAFDKPTLVIKDDQTDYSFDTSIIEHITYPRDLRFSRIVTFKESLKKKIQATHQKATSDPNYTTFLKNFGEYKVAHLVDKEISSDKFILNAIEEMRKEIINIRHNQSSLINNYKYETEKPEHIKMFLKSEIDDYLKVNNLKITDLGFNTEKKEELCKYLEQYEGIRRMVGTSGSLRRLIDDIVDPF